MPFMGELCVLEINLCNFAHFYGNFMNRFYQYAINHDFLKKYLWEITNICDILTIFFFFEGSLWKTHTKTGEALETNNGNSAQKSSFDAVLCFCYINKSWWQIILWTELQSANAQFTRPYFSDFTISWKINLARGSTSHIRTQQTSKMNIQC